MDRANRRQHNATADFVQKGILLTVAGTKGPFITPEELERFRRTYVTVPELAEILGVKRSRDAIALLASAGIEPACPRPAYWKVLYWREEAVAAVKKIARALADMKTA